MKKYEAQLIEGGFADVYLASDVAELVSALKDSRMYVDRYEPRDVSEAHDRDLMLSSIDALTTSLMVTGAQR